MPDSPVIRIPMAYVMPCETLRFASRNERFVLPVFQPRRRTKRNAGAGPCRSEGQISGIALAATHRAGSTNPSAASARPPTNRVQLGGDGDSRTRKWRRKLLKSLKTDSGYGGTPVHGRWE